jgi:hypothetical protein
MNKGKTCDVTESLTIKMNVQNLVQNVFEIFQNYIYLVQFLQVADQYSEQKE